jgi:hypothetical protein
MVIPPTTSVSSVTHWNFFCIAYFIVTCCCEVCLPTGSQCCVTQQCKWTTLVCSKQAVIDFHSNEIVGYRLLNQLRETNCEGKSIVEDSGMPSLSAVQCAEENNEEYQPG